MKGIAPKSPFTGSQLCPKKKPSPNSCSESRDLSTNSHTTNTTIANTDIAVRRMSMRNAASGRPLLRGCVSRILCSTDEATPVFRSLTACAIVGMTVIGFWVCSAGSGDFIGSKLSAIPNGPGGFGIESNANSPASFWEVGASHISPIANYLTCWLTAALTLSTTSLGSGA